MDLADDLICEIYNFYKYDEEMKNDLYYKLSYFLSLGGYLKWPKSRCKLLLPLISHLLGKTLSDEERLLLEKTERDFFNINTVKTLDLCLMFWQITHDDKYSNYIKKIADSSGNFLNKYAIVVSELNKL